MRLILFDIDGTLIRSHGVGRQAFGDAVQSVLGLPDPFVDFCFGGLTDPIIVAHVLREGRVPVERHDEITAALYESYLQHLDVGLRTAAVFEVLPGVTEMLDHMRETGWHALAVGTGNIEAGARLKLGRAQLDHYFPTGGFGSDASDRADVLAAGVRKARDHYGCDFDDVWVVGDTTRDVQAGLRIGANVIGVTTGSTSGPELREAGSMVVCDTLEDPEAWRLLVGDGR